jgi:hypothetical protein
MFSKIRNHLQEQVKMKNKIRIALLSVAAASFASAATYQFTLPVDATVDGQDLKAGHYKVDVNDTTAVIKGGKTSIETKVSTQTTERKHDATSIRYLQVSGKNTLQVIHVGGKKLNLVFESNKTASGGF